VVFDEAWVALLVLVHDSIVTLMLELIVRKNGFHAVSQSEVKTNESGRSKARPRNLRSVSRAMLCGVVQRLGRTHS
jgi:hypothetical protein